MSEQREDAVVENDTYTQIRFWVDGADDRCIEELLTAALKPLEDDPRVVQIISVLGRRSKSQRPDPVGERGAAGG